MRERGGARFNVLGPLEVILDDRRIAVPSGQLRSVLALLVLGVGRSVSVSEMAERLWPDRLPGRVRGTVHTYVARLRRLLGDDLIQTSSGGGYLIAVPAENVDLCRFRALIRDSRTAASTAAESAALEEALGLWRGRAFADMNDAWLDRQVVPRLTEEWLAAIERQIDLRIQTGQAGEVIAELRELIAGHPTRELLWLRLMDALHRAGRRVEALDTYQQVRAVLAEEFGIDPSHRLQQMHRAILLSDTAPTEPSTTPLGLPSGPVRQMPPDIVGFCGRAELNELDRLVPVIEGEGRRLTTVVAIDGAPGTGKTTLALHWAHEVAHVYPDLQLYVNLRGYGPGSPMPPSAAAESLLRSLGMDSKAIPTGAEERAALLRTVLAGKRALLFLDNARDADQVRPLLPGGDSLVVITSRNQLRGLSIRDGAHRVTLGPLPMREALSMLAAVLGADRVAAEAESAGRLVELCDGLPLAMAVVAERAMRADSLSEVVDALVDEKARLDMFRAGEADPHTDLRAALSWSYRALDPDAAAMFRMLGLHPTNDIALDAAAALAGVPASRAKESLDHLVAAHLVQQRRQNRFELHDLIRRYATERAELDDPALQRDAAVHRMLDWYLRAAVSVDNALAPQRCRDFLEPYDAPEPTPRFGSAAEAIAWFEREYECLRAVVNWAAVNGWPEQAWRIAIASTTIFDARIPWRDGIEFYESALHAAERGGEPVGEAFVLNSLGCIYLDREDWRTARDYFHRSLNRFRASSHSRGEAMTLGNLGIAYAGLGCYERARRYVFRALSRYRTLHSPRGVALNLDNLGVAFAGAGKHREAIGYYLEARSIVRELDDRHHLAIMQHHLGTAYLAVGELRNAVHALGQATREYRAMGNRRWEAYVLTDLGKTLQQTGHTRLGNTLLETALTTLTEFADPKIKDIQTIIDDAAY
jgi:DNA-binding SARP family transcriptional activator/tetratricopeptide (TPR) repeat protein